MFTRDSVIEAIKKFDSLYGRPPTKTEWSPWLAISRGHQDVADRFHSDGCWPSSKIVRRLFGTWQDGIRAAGFEPKKSRSHRAWTRDDLIAAATEYVKSLPPDIAPSLYGFIRSGMGPRGAASVTRIISPRELWDVVQQDVLGEWPDLPDVPPDPSVRVIADKVRAIDVFAADGFRCTYCGRSPSEHDVVLHVDHKVPVSCPCRSP